MIAFKRIKANHAVVMAGLRRWKASEQWTKDGGKFVPHPRTRVKREGWNDAIAGEVAPMSGADLEAVRMRTEEAERQHKERMAKLVEHRSNQLLGRAS